MREITMDLLKKCANNLMFDMKDEEYQTLYQEFDILKKQMSLIGEIEGLDDQEPMTFPFPCEVTYLREDVESEPLSVEEVLSNVKETAAGQVKLPKVVG